MRKLKQPIPTSKYPEIRVDKESFGVMEMDTPPCDVTGTTFLNNVHSFFSKVGKKVIGWLEGRTGSREQGWNRLPKLPGYEHITASQNSNTITKSHGTDFTMALIGSYFVWPGEPDRAYAIIAVPDADTLTVQRADDRTNMDGWIVGPTCLLEPHDILKKIVLQIDTRFFWTDLTNKTWQEIYKVGYWAPAASKSMMKIVDDGMIVANANGQFKLMLTPDDLSYYYKLNVPPPTYLPADWAETPVYKYGRNITYTNLRLRGDSTFTYHMERNSGTGTSAQVIIEHETGNVRANEENKDYFKVFTELPIGPGTDTYGVLTCDNTVCINKDINDWRTLDDASFQININGLGVVDIVLDLSFINSIEDIAEIIQEALRAYDPEATVEIATVGAISYFIFRTGKRNGNTISLLTASALGTDISNVDAGSGCGLRGSAAPAAVTTPNYNEPEYIGRINIALTNGGGAPVESQHTHYGIYGTMNVNDAGNNPDYYVWLHDIPVAKAYTGAVNAAGALTLTQGVLTVEDVGSIIEAENGTRFRLYTYLTPLTGTVVDVAAGSTVYTGPVVASQSLGLGNEQNLATFDVFTMTKTNHDLYVVSGKLFIASDVGKPVFLSDGTIEYIKEVVTATHAKTISDNSKVQLAGVMNPNSRNYNDTVLDQTISDRQEFFPLYQRWWIELPDTRIMTIVPGFMAVADEGTNKYMYSPMPPERKYLIGSYDPYNHVEDKIKDEIIRFSCNFPDLLVVQCQHSTWSTPTNQALTFKDDKRGVAISVLPSVNLVDDIGILYPESFAKVGVGREFILTSEPAVRLFDGKQYSSTNYADKQVMKIIKRMNSISGMMYNPAPEGGLVIYGAEVE